MPSTPSRYGVDAVTYGRPPPPPKFDAYDDVDTQRSTQLQYHQQPLRRHGAPVPAPPSLLSTKSSVTLSLHATPVENLYESTSTSPSSSGGTAATSPPARPHRGSSARRHARDTSTSVTGTSNSAISNATSSSPTTTTSSSSAHAGQARRSGVSHSPSITAAPTPLNGPSSPTTVDVAALPNFTARSLLKSSEAPRSLSRRARDKSRRTPTPEDLLRGGAEGPRVPPTRGSGLAPRQRPPAVDGPTIVRASTPAAPSPPSPSSLHSLLDGEGQRRSTTRGGATRYPLHRDANNTVGGSWSRSSTTSDGSALPLHMRQETRLPSPSPAMTHSHSASSTPSPEVMAAGPIIVSNAERKKAERAARKQRRHSIYNGDIRVLGYVAQSAYAQRNPFRQQDFAEFAANPKYQPPDGFDIYSQAMATQVYGLEVSRASQGEFMMQRLVEASHPATAEERAEMEALLSSTLEKLQVGDWFYKWTRINRVHQRYVWLNLQRGTLMWSLSPKQSVVLNAEVKLSTVTSITPDCLQLEAPVRVFYRMTINTPDRCISLATEIRKKFDVWYRVLLQLTAPNLVYGVPGVWSRPSSSVNTTGRGAASRWASRFSPLDAVVNDTTGHLGHDEIYTQGLLSSSD